MILFRVLAVLLMVAGTAFAEKKPKALPPPADVVKNLETLRGLIPAILNAEKELEKVRDELTKALTEEAKKEITARLDTQRERVNQLRSNFRIVATGVEDTAYLSAAEEEASFDNEFKDLLKPLFNGLREATSKPREMEELRSELRVWVERQKVSKAALDRTITAVAAAPEESEVRKELEDTRKLWASRVDEASSETQTLSRQIEEREKNTPSALDMISGMLSDFWRSRGLNLLLAFGTALAVYLITRRVYRGVRKISPLHRRRGNGLMARSADLIVAAAAVVLAVFTATLIFYLKGDWLMLAITIIFLLGMLWASKRALPPYIEQIKVILNLGSVRQGERLIYGGIPWRVDALNMYCDFSNPELTGGTMRLPVKDLLPLHSRVSEAKEPWFPTKENDWVSLGDGTFGKVLQQTPEQVVVLRLGGSLKTYPTADFLDQCPENLSRGFRVSTIFGIGYGHRGGATNEVPEALQEGVLRHLVEALGREMVKSVRVEFNAAASSSLDYRVLADFNGEAAQRYSALERMIQTACIDVCNEKGWDIPFPQMVIHQAAAS